MKVGLVGCGRIGGRHADAYLKLGHVEIMVADEDEAAAKELAGTLDVTAVSTEELLDSDIDALDVCVPSHVHLPWIMRGLERELHVFCEKPLCLNHADALRIRDAAVRANRNVMVGYLYRHHPAFKFMKDIIERGVIGRPHFAMVRLGGRGSHRAWKHGTEGGGVIFEMMVHMLDLVHWLLGPLDEGRLMYHELLVPVRQIDGKSCQVHAPDSAVVSLAAGGVPAICQSDLVTPSFMNYVEVHGDNGSVAGSILDSMPTGVYCHEPRGIYDRGHNPMPARPTNLFVEELKGFVQLVESGRLDLSALSASVDLARFVDSLLLEA
jgi:predicted dehydrogenase